MEVLNEWHVCLKDETFTWLIDAWLLGILQRNMFLKAFWQVGIEEADLLRHK